MLPEAFLVGDGLMRSSLASRLRMAGKVILRSDQFNSPKDVSLRHLQQMRLKSTMHGLGMLPLFILGFGWVSAEHVHISAMCVMLFFCGFFAM